LLDGGPGDGLHGGWG